MTKALLVLGADPNVLSSNMYTPRHLAAKLNDKIKVELVRCLSICGGDRCPAKRVGCGELCTDRRSLSLHHQTPPLSSRSPGKIRPSHEQTATADATKEAAEEQGGGGGINSRSSTPPVPASIDGVTSAKTGSSPEIGRRSMIGLTSIPLNALIFYRYSTQILELSRIGNALTPSLI